MINKLVLHAFMLFTWCAASAQAQTTFGVKGGLNMASATNNTSAISRFSAGAFANIGMSKSVWFQPGIYYSGKGYKLHQSGIYTPSFEYDLVASNISTTRVRNERTKINYLQIPLNFIYHKSIKLGNIFIGAGPFASIALNGRYKGYIEYSAVVNQIAILNRYDFDRKIRIGEEPRQMEDYTQYADIERIDWGVTALTGLAFKNGLLFTINYDLGLNNIRADNYDNLKTRVLGLSIGFEF